MTHARLLTIPLTLFASLAAAPAHAGELFGGLYRLHLERMNVRIPFQRRFNAIELEWVVIDVKN